MLTSVLSLTAISVNRYYIINHMKNENMNVRITNSYFTNTLTHELVWTQALDKRRRAIIVMIVFIWLFSFLAASPTLFTYRYWVRSADTITFQLHYSLNQNPNWRCSLMYHVHENWEHNSNPCPLFELCLFESVLISFTDIVWFTCKIIEQKARNIRQYGWK